MPIADMADDGESELEQAAAVEITAGVKTAANTAKAAHDLRVVVGELRSTRSRYDRLTRYLRIHGGEFFGVAAASESGRQRPYGMYAGMRR